MQFEVQVRFDKNKSLLALIIIVIHEMKPFPFIFQMDQNIGKKLEDNINKVREQKRKKDKKARDGPRKLT